MTAGWNSGLPQGWRGARRCRENRGPFRDRRRDPAPVTCRTRLRRPRKRTRPAVRPDTTRCPACTAAVAANPASRIRRRPNCRTGRRPPRVNRGPPAAATTPANRRARRPAAAGAATSTRATAVTRYPSTIRRSHWPCRPRPRHRQQRPRRPRTCAGSTSGAWASTASRRPPATVRRAPAPGSVAVFNTAVNSTSKAAARDSRPLRRVCTNISTMRAKLNDFLYVSESPPPTYIILFILIFFASRYILMFNIFNLNTIITITIVIINY